MINTIGKLILAVLALSCAQAQASVDVTQFSISKVWDQAGDTDALEVDADLSCTGGNPTQRHVVFTATTDAILFVYDIGLAPGPVDCTITEVVPDNYSADYESDCDGGSNCGDSDTDTPACFFPDVNSRGSYGCTITNTPEPATITVTKTWIIEGADQGFDGGFYLSAFCDSPVRGPDDYGCRDGCFAEVREEEAAAKPTDYEFTILKPNYPFTQCEIREQPDDNVIDIENGCGEMRLSAGEDLECEVVNTVFFEGIPTLNQYGMAILALLMLGVGFAGFRRFV